MLSAVYSRVGSSSSTSLGFGLSLQCILLHPLRLLLGCHSLVIWHQSHPICAGGNFEKAQTLNPLPGCPLRKLKVRWILGFLHDRYCEKSIMYTKIPNPMEEMNGTKEEVWGDEGGCIATMGRSPAKYYCYYRLGCVRQEPCSHPGKGTPVDYGVFSTEATVNKWLRCMSYQRGVVCTVQRFHAG